MSETVQHPVVRLRDGIVRGRVEAGVAAFLGIPYAAPPFGPNRMLPPQPVPAWAGERDATAFGPTVPKGDYPPQYLPLFPEEVIPGEDCLNLNVWTPADGAGGLPVLVWIHGGSFMNGSGSVGAYDGAAFARDGVVCVTINYRLAAEGFLFLGDGIANLGLLDQLAALRWVQENIAAFGGDPGRVTVAGESAGAMSVTTLLSMPLAAGLFGQAIAQSGAGAHTLTADEGRMVAGYLAEALGVPPDRDSIKAVPLDKLVQAASDLVVEVQTAPHAGPGAVGQLTLSLLPFAPTVDGSVLPAAPLASFAAGQGGNVPLLIGSNRDEARLFLVAAGTIDLIDEPTLAAVAGAYGLSGEALAVYRADRAGASPGDLLAAVITDWFFRIPPIRVAEARTAAGASDTWMYRFDHPDPRDNYRFGACHAAEIPFRVRSPPRPGRLRPLIGDAPSAVANVAHRVWAGLHHQRRSRLGALRRGRRTTGLLGDTAHGGRRPGRRPTSAPSGTASAIRPDLRRARPRRPPARAELHGGRVRTSDHRGWLESYECGVLPKEW